MSALRSLQLNEYILTSGMCFIEEKCLYLLYVSRYPHSAWQVKIKLTNPDLKLLYGSILNMLLQLAQN